MSKSHEDRDLLTMFDPSPYLFAVDLAGRDVTVTIAGIEAGELTSEGNRKAKKPIMSIAERPDKKLALNKTNVKMLKKLFGTRRVGDLIGKRITIYPTTTMMGGEEKECIRIRPTVPPARQQQRREEPRDTEQQEPRQREPGED